MTPKNKYVNNSKISEEKFREIIKYFALDLEVNKISILTNITSHLKNTSAGLLYNQVVACQGNYQP